MFKRKIEKELIKWKNEQKYDKKALIIKGLRQVGKSTSILDFVNKNYKKIIYLDFLEKPILKKVFSNDLNSQSILLALNSIGVDTNIIPNETVLFFDEIQECAAARQSIKYLLKDERFDIIGSGSLLGLKGYNKKYNISTPTGFEKIIEMKPMDFEEFLWANNITDETINYLNNCFINHIKINEAIHESMLNYFKQYMIIGGMPNAVNVFLKTNNYNKVREIQKNLILEFKDDFGKYLDKDENRNIDGPFLAKINEVFNSIPSQLAKENKKFNYSLLNRHATSRNYLSAITYLEEFGLVSIVYNLNNLELPLEGNKNQKEFKIYFNDIGLFVSLLGNDISTDILLDNLKIYKGAIFENLIADSFIKNNKKLYYFKKNSGLEIDFVIEYNNETTLMEVKAGSNKSKSLSTLLSSPNYNVKSNFKLGNYNIGQNKGINTIPYYLAFLIK